LEVTFKSEQQLKGFQFTMLLHGLEVVGVRESDNVTAGNFGLVFDNMATVSIDYADGVAGGAQAFTLRFRANKSGKLSEMLSVSGSITRAEAYPASAEAMAGKQGRLAVAFRFRSATGLTINSLGFELYQNQPNPFANKTNIGFYLPQAAEATLSVFDESGRVVWQQKGQFAKGENCIQLDAGLVIPQGTGVLYYKLQTATDSATKKMIQMR
ncbi:MAG: T9SS type A sorting domain-containing protein, partial [Phycisphaerae bacterium]|nr:T9SS type A sorting domain-containing protein [Saprospiraceae bacterium]